MTITAIAQQLFERWTPDKARALQFCCRCWMGLSVICIRLVGPAKH
ncbi:MAG: hypothetical protein ACLRXQ_03600 [Phascolarctobacterium faecium]